MRACDASAKFTAPRLSQQSALPAAPTPQPVTPAPICIALEDRTGPPTDDDGYGDG